jgi:hypothetical protein
MTDRSKLHSLKNRDRVLLKHGTWDKDIKSSPPGCVLYGPLQFMETAERVNDIIDTGVEEADYA